VAIFEFEWDENKRLSNVEKHGVDFFFAAHAFDGRPTYTYRSPRGGEDRWGTVARLDDGHVYVVIWTEREERVRIISAHRAYDREVRAYRALHDG
jgi:uncharacterized DUF497 family protein